MSTSPVSLRTEKMVAGGDAMAHLDDGRVAFVTGALPGELVDVHVRNDRKDFVKADVVDVLEPSPDRVVPSCPHRRDGCGGCDWMHFVPAAQVEAKLDIVAESLRRIGSLDAETIARIVRPGAAVEPYGYRTTIRLVGAPGGGVGFREERSDSVVDIDHCQVAHENLAPLLREITVAPGVELTLRTSAATGAITARWTRPEDRRRRNERRRASAPPGQSVSGLPAEVHIGDRAFLAERVAGRSLRVSAPSFFQSGPDAAELLVDAVRRAAPELARARHAADLYGGIGLFAATLMRDADRVTLVESSRSACLDAQENLSNAEVVRGEVGEWSPDPAHQPIDVVVADPARPGLAAPGVGAIARADAPVVVLVSCDAGSLGRDLRLLADEGYRAENVEVLDLFPQTHHVECVTRLVRD